MGLKTPAEYIESLRDGRVTFWDGERIDDITTHPRFKTPIAVACGDYDYDNPARREVMALLSVKDAVAEVKPEYAANIERMYRYIRDNDLRAAEVITDPKGDRS